jgi:hypothetical protein
MDDVADFFALSGGDIAFKLRGDVVEIRNIKSLRTPGIRLQTDASLLISISNGVLATLMHRSIENVTLVRLKKYGTEDEGLINCTTTVFAAAWSVYRRAKK